MAKQARHPFCGTCMDREQKWPRIHMTCMEQATARRDGNRTQEMMYSGTLFTPFWKKQEITGSEWLSVGQELRVGEAVTNR